MSKKINYPRRQTLKAIGAIAAGSVLTGCMEGGTNGDGSQQEPLTIGGLNPVSGPLSVLGERQRNGIKLAIEQINENGGVLGQEIEVVYEDSASQPQVKARRLVERDNADVLVGIVSSGTSVQIQEYLRNEQVDTLMCSCVGSDVVTSTPNCTEQYYMMKWDNAQVTHAAVPVAEQHGTDWYFIAHDYNWGKDSVAKMKSRISQQTDVPIDDVSIGESYIPIDQTDLRSVIQEAVDADPDVIGVALVGAGYTALVNQAADLGVEIPIHHDYAENAAIEGSAESVEKLTMTAGVDYTFTNRNYEPGLRFAQDYNDRFGHWPEWTSATVYDTTYWIANVVGQVGSTDPTELQDPLNTSEHSGSIKADYVYMKSCYQNAVVPIHVVEARVTDEFDVPAWYVTETLDNSEGQLMQECGAEIRISDETRCNFQSG